MAVVQQPGRNRGINRLSNNLRGLRLLVSDLSEQLWLPFRAPFVHVITDT